MIKGVGYDAKSRTLEVLFDSGETYRYDGVPRRVYERLMAADSKGRFMHSEIIDMYPTRRVSGRRGR